MDIIVMWLGFFLASFSVVGNDVIQTLGTFLTSNESRFKWYVLWLYAAAIMSAALIYGYLQQDISYGRLDKFQDTLLTLEYSWYYLLPPVILLTITRFGIPVSTTFMILTLFSLSDIPDDIGSMLTTIVDTDSKLGGMIEKSLIGYFVGLGAALIIYLLISRLTENYFLANPLKKQYEKYWMATQWIATGFLWFQWLSQDLANIYVYLQGGYSLSPIEFAFSLAILLILLGIIFYIRGGRVQDVVRQKINTIDVRSATFIDFIYAVVLYIFKYNYFGLWQSNIPMSTTWVFIGLLAGREIAIRFNLKELTVRVWKHLAMDLVKVFAGLFVSVVLVFIIKLLA